MSVIFTVFKWVLGLVFALTLGASVFLAGWYTTRNWPNVTARDIEAMHALVKHHHPGAVDPENPTFTTAMDAARTAALALSEQAQGRQGHHFALRRYANGFEDGHVSVFFFDQWLDPLWRRFAGWTWPGFVAQWEGGAMAVRSSVSDEINAGDTILSCDGQAVESLAQAKVFAFEGRFEDLSSRRLHGPKLFLSGRNPFVNPVETCVFQTADYEPRRVALDWTHISPSTWDRKVAPWTGRADVPEMGVDISGPRAWITIPSFNDRLSSGIADLAAEVAANAEALRESETIVFDLRGNGGGNSAHGRRILQALVGEEAYADWVPPRAAAVEWRVSQENIDHVRGIAGKNKSQGRDDAAESWNGVAEGMTDALAQGRPLYRQVFSQRTVTRSAPLPVQGKIFVLTDGACARACLDFMDAVTRFPNATHVGARTASDTAYIDVRHELAPSYAAALIVPLKVSRDRLRPPGGAYEPEIAYPGTDWSRTALESWISGLSDSGAADKDVPS